jgi:hypothetical protein
MDLKFLETLFSRVPVDSIAIIVLALLMWRIAKVNGKEELEETKFIVNRLTILGVVVSICQLIPFIVNKLSL